MGWYAVDLDGTLAHYEGWVSVDHIGAPVPLMADRVKTWLAAGEDVRVFTARVCESPDQEQALAVIEAWCLEHFGQVLPVTNRKDFGMIALWDDRCVQVVPNTGQAVEEVLMEAAVVLHRARQIVAEQRDPEGEVFVLFEPERISEALLVQEIERLHAALGVE